jgi:hypothetical protein
MPGGLHERDAAFAPGLDTAVDPAENKQAALRRMLTEWPALLVA